MLRRLRRPRHHPARQRRRHAALPVACRASASSRATTPRRCTSATASSPSSTPRSPRSSARPATTCPASTRSARRPPSSGSRSSARSRRCSSTRDEIKGVVGDNLREQRENARRNRRLNRLLTDVELPVGPADLVRRPIDEQAVREIFERLEFRTLLERVLSSRAAGRRPHGTPEGARGRAERRPQAPVPQRAARTRSSQAWLDAQTAANPDGPRRRQSRRQGGRVDRSASPGATSPSTCRGEPGAARTDYAPLERWLAERRAEGVPRREAAAQGAAARRARRSAASPSTRSSPAGCCARASTTRRSPTSSTATSHEKLPEGDPTQLVPETEGATGPRRAGLVRAAASRTRCATARRARPAACSPTSSCRRCSCSPTWRPPASRSTPSCSRRLGAELATRIDGLAQEAYAIDRPRGEPRLAQAAAGGAVRRARHAEDPQDEDRVLDGRRLARRSAGDEPAPVPRPAAAAPRRDEAAADHRVARRGDRRRRPHPHDLRADRHQTGRISSNDPNLQNIPVRTEEGRRIRAAFVHGDEVRDAAHRRLLADRDAHHGAPLRGRRADRGVQLRRGPAPLRRRARVRRRARRGHPAMRTKVKAMSYGLAYGLSAFGLSKQLRIDTQRGEAADDGLLRAVRRRARLPAQRRRAGEGRRLHRDDLRPPPAVPRPHQPNRVLRENAERARSTRRSRAPPPTS